MSRSIDERIVSMVFENTKFEAGVAKTMGTLAKLDTSLKKIGSVNAFGDIEKAANKVTLQQPASALDKLKGKLHFGRESADGFGEIERAGNRVTLAAPAGALDKFSSKLSHVGTHAQDTFGDVEKASSRVSFDGLSSALDGLGNKFNVLQIAAGTALGNIATKVGAMGTSTAKGLTLGPVISGYKEYELKLNSIQTILANTKAAGTTLKDVTGALNELNTYADKTIYNFGQMAKNIGTFTAAGVDLKTATASIKGIANLAALSGTNSEQASRAMYQLSQAISSGRVSLMDWKSVENAGMGGAVFQKNLAQTAVAMGKLDKSAIKINKTTGKLTVNGQSFRESIMAKPGEQSWLASEVLTSSLQQFTGDMTDAELAAKGFSKAQIKAIQDQAKTALEAATKVKTFTQLMDTTKESIESGWAETWEIVFGDFEEARKLWSSVSKTVGGFIGGVTEARNKALEGWDKLGGRSALIEGVKSAFQALFAVLKPISKAFRDIFPRKTGKDLYEMTVNFRDLMKTLKPSTEVVDGLRRTFRGLFAVLHIAWEVVKGVVGVFGKLLGAAGKNSEGFLDFTGSIGDFLVALDKAITQGGKLKSVFDTLEAIIEKPLKVIKDVAKAFAGLFRIDGKEFDFAAAFTPLAKAIGLTQENLKKFIEFFEGVQERLQPVMDFLGRMADRVRAKIDEMISALTSDRGLKILQTGFLGGIFVMLKKIVGGFDLSVGVKGIDEVNRSLSTITKTLQTIQGTLHAANLMAVAIAVGLLAASMTAVASIDSEGLERALGGLAVGLGQMLAAMTLMGKGFKGFVGFGVASTAASMIALAVALNLLAAAMFLMSRLDWESIAKGFVGLTSGLYAMAIGIEMMGPKITVVAPAMIALAFALGLLSVAMKILGSMSWESIAKGLLGIDFALAAIRVSTAGIGPQITVIAPALIALGGALILIATAIGILGQMKVSTLVKGILGIAFALEAIGFTVSSMPPTLAAQAGGLILVGIALQSIAVAVGIMGALGMKQIIKGLIGIGGAMAILAAGLYFMIGTGPAALALLGAAAALAILVPTMILLGLTPWTVILKGLAGVVLILGILAAVGAAVAGPLAAMGGALQMLGLGMMAIAASIFIFSAALRLLAIHGTKGVIALTASIGAFMLLIPTFAKGIALGFVEILRALVDLAPEIVKSLAKIMDIIATALTESSPKLAIGIGTMIDSVLVIVVPKLIMAGWKMLLALLQGIDDNIEEVVPRVASIVTKFLTSLAGQAPMILNAGVKFVTSYVAGLLDGVANNIWRVVNAAGRLLSAFLNAIAQNVNRVRQAGVSFIVSLMNGIADASVNLVRGGLRAARKFLNGLADGLAGLADIGFRAIIRFLNGLEKAIRDNSDDLFEAGAGVADAVVDGLVEQFGKLGPLLRRVLDKVFGLLPGWARKILGIKSPSKVFMEIGEYTMQGFIVGIEQSQGAAKKSIQNAAGDVMSTAKSSFGTNILDGVMDTDPTIRPVLDLSQVQKDAGALGDLTSVAPIKAGVSLDQAAAISQQTAAVEQTQADQAAAAEKPTVHYEQNNYSPEALSTVEIYRRTNNQLSKIRKEVGIV